MTTLIGGYTARRVSEFDAVSAGRDGVFRVSPHGELAVRSALTPQQNAAMFGQYFCATNGTYSTAVATTTSITSFDATKPVFLFYNTETDTLTGKSIVLDYLTCNIVQVPTSATSWQYGLQLDTVDRYSSAGTAVTPKNMNGFISTASICRVHFGAVVTTAASANVRNAGRGALRGIIPTTFDEMGFRFGSHGDNSALLTSGSAKYYSTLPPVVIGPGQSLLIGMWGASNAAAPTFEFTAGWYEI